MDTRNRLTPNRGQEPTVRTASAVIRSGKPLAAQVAMGAAISPNRKAAFLETKATRGGKANEGGDTNSSLPLWPIVVGALAGAILAVVVVLAWLATLGASAGAGDQKVYWYIARAAGLTSFALLWFSMASGLLISNKIARRWPGALTAFDLHQFTSLLGLAFIVVHVVALLGDQYVGYSVLQLLAPFASGDYRPVWVGLGQVGLYLFLPVTFTFYIRKHIGTRAWRAIHFASYAVFALSMLHGLFSGTDSNNGWVQATYWVSGLSLIILTVYRVRVSKLATGKAAKSPDRSGAVARPAEGV